MNCALLLFLGTAFAIRFDLQPQNRKIYTLGRCVSLQIEPKKLVTGFFAISPAENQTVSIRITDNFGNSHYNPPAMTHEQVRFSFRTHEQKLTYNFCIKTVNNSENVQGHLPAREVQLEIDVGDDLFDKNTADKVKIQPAIAEMVRLGGIMNDISDGLEGLLESGGEIERKKRTVFRSVFLINMLCIFVMAGSGIWQFYHMRKFFKTKKLI